MAYYDVCPDCGANLDPGESCNCRDEEMRKQESIEKMFQENQDTGQYEFRFSEMAGSYVSRRIR